jgi:hypothetical protein
VQERQSLSIVAILAEDFTDADVEFAKSGLLRLGLDRLWLMPGHPPKLTMTLALDANQERIDEVVAFLKGVEHVEGVRLSYPSWRRGP